MGRLHEVNDGYSHAIARARALVDEIQALLARAPPAPSRNATHVNERGRMRWGKDQELTDRGWTMHAAAGAYDHAHVCPCITPQLLAFMAVGSRE